jgi:hypothetical protein
MKRKWMQVVVLLAIFLSLPAAAAENRSSFGGALVFGTLDCDSCVDELDFVGFSLFGKIGITDNWGLLLKYRDMEDDEEFFLGEEDTYTQFAVQGVYMWRAREVFRPHVKFGLERTDFEAEIPGLLKESDDGVALAVGGGFEAGTPRVAFILDYDFTRVELFDEDFDLANLDLGIIFKF